MTLCNDSGAPRVTVGFTAQRDEVLAALYLMGVSCCAYSAGDKWADFCDCKYGIGKRGWPHGGEEGNGCPELRSLYGVIQGMSDRDWARHVRRGGGTLRAALPGEQS